MFTFAELRPRRTQALNVGLEGTEPFHWAGDLADMDALVDEVRTHRMGGAELEPLERAALGRFVYRLPPERPSRDADDEAAVSGEALFGAIGCSSCHSGSALTNNETIEFNAMWLQVPTLRGVYYRAPYMHDGRSADLTAAVVDMLLVVAREDLSDAAIADIVAYLESL